MGLSVPVRHQYDRVGVWIHTGGLVAGGVHECSNAVSMGAPATGRCCEHVLLPRRWTSPSDSPPPQFFRNLILLSVLVSPDVPVLAQEKLILFPNPGAEAT